jgi:hypothetical protein
MSAVDAVLAGHPRRGDELAIEFTDHSIERFAERLGRDLDPGEVRKQRSRMLSSAIITVEKPDWVEASTHTAAYLILSDIVQPLARKGDKFDRPLRARLGHRYSITPQGRGSIGLVPFPTPRRSCRRTCDGVAPAAPGVISRPA